MEHSCILDTYATLVEFSSHGLGCLKILSSTSSFFPSPFQSSSGEECTTTNGKCGSFTVGDISATGI